MMKQRAPLRRQVIRAWCRTIGRDYGRINSERSLQASFWAHLFALFPSKSSRHIFLEPKITLTDGQMVYPDLLICNSRTVIGAVELKYLPRADARHKKDLTTLTDLAESRNDIVLENVRYQGDAPPKKKFKFAEHVLFVWAGVYSRSRSVGIASKGLPEECFAAFSDSFLQLHAITEKGSPPKVRWLPELDSDADIKSKNRELVEDNNSR